MALDTLADRLFFNPVDLLKDPKVTQERVALTSGYGSLSE